MLTLNNWQYVVIFPQSGTTQQVQVVEQERIVPSKFLKKMYMLSSCTGVESAANEPTKSRLTEAASRGTDSFATVQC